MPKQLDKISIKGFKSIRELIDFPLGNLNILIGANGAGKTNFISFFTLLNEIVKNNLQVFIGIMGGSDVFLYYGQKNTILMEFDLKFGCNDYKFSLISTTDDRLIFSDESISYHKSEKYNAPIIYSLGRGHKETRLYFESDISPYRSVADYVIEALIDWRVYHFHDTSISAKIKKQGNINDNKYLRPDASNLAAFLYLLRETKEDFYKKIVSSIRLVAPFFDDFSLRPNPLKPDTIILEWREKNSDAYFDANSFSDGTLRFICLATLLLQPDLPSSIIIDEPELGLHPYAITILASLLKSVSQKTQVIISTQSVTLVNQFSPDDIIVVDREDGQSTFKCLSQQSLENWLDDYSIGDLWEKNVIGGRPA